MKHILTFSGGKDSLATIIWAKRNLPDFEVVFCDTKWEAPETYDHIKDVEQWMGITIKVLVSSKYDGFEDLSVKKGRVASTKARFCTEELKVKPMIDYLLSIKDDVIVYQGIRGEESNARAKMKIKDEYFRYYFEPYTYKKRKIKNKVDKQSNLFGEVPTYREVLDPVTYSYRKKDIEAHCDQYTVDVFRPIFLLTAEEVFDEIKRYGIKPNPLYFEGFSRVGCFPCIMCTLSEIRLIAQRFPERIDFIRKMEQENGITFFPPEYIPARSCTKIVKGGKRVPTIDDVVKYVQENDNQAFPRTACQSIYNICE